MSEFTSFCSIIGLWPSKEAMAADIGANASAVSKWGQRDSIPAEWWQPILLTPIAVRAGLSPAVLAQLAARGRSIQPQEAGAGA